MPETTESETYAEPGGHVISELADALRYIGDCTYAILPEDVAHSVGDLKKSFLTTIRSLIDKDIEWVEARVAGGDKLRQEWHEKWRDKSEGAPEPVN